MILSQNIEKKNTLKDKKNKNSYNVIRKEGYSSLKDHEVFKNKKKFISEKSLNNIEQNVENQENKVEKTSTFGSYLNNHSKIITDIMEKELEFRTLQQRALNALMNHQNINSYLLKLSIKNYLITFNQLFKFNSNMNYNFNNCPNIHKKFGNSLFNNSFQYEINQKKNNEPENYEITFKIPTNYPNIKKVKKIEINTSFIKDNGIIKQKNNDSIEEVINIDDIYSGKEKRTVVRLIPIPPKYSSFDIIKLIDHYLGNESKKGIYKAIYTPFSQKKGKNFGFCFIMLIKPKYVINFYNKINGVIFRKKKCNKPCKVIWADIQGDDFLNPKEAHRRPIIFQN